MVEIQLFHFAADSIRKMGWSVEDFLVICINHKTNLFPGVFTTTMVNIFGVIVFLRSGWIVAQAGILNAILVIVCTVSIALVSVLSAIGIVERIRVETG